MKKILFVCIENSCRSQIAEGYARHFGTSIIDPYSAGSMPSGYINPDAIKIMQEDGVNIASQKSKGFNDLNIKDFDIVITLGCNDTCPFVPSKKHINWQIEDPKGKSMDFFRKIRNDIKERVRKLIRRQDGKTF